VKNLSSDKKFAWQMTAAEFESAVGKGRVVPATGKETPAERKYLEEVGGNLTPLGHGEAAGYTPEEISHFYYTYQRTIGHSHAEAIRIARKWLVQDAMKEGKPVPAEILREIELGN
jgi:hypothetical protein